MSTRSEEIVVNDNTDLLPIWLKLIVVWAGTIFGSISLQQVVLAATLLYTLLQCYVLVRDKIVARGQADADE